MVCRPNPDSEIAFTNNPRAIGEATRSLTLIPPADSPKIVTLETSPPNAAMFCCTHLSAAIWSSRPKLPLASPLCSPENGRMGEEAQKAQPVVDRPPGRRRAWARSVAVIERHGGAAVQEAAAEDPHHHRQLGARARVRRPDVERQAVFALRQVRHEEAGVAVLRADGSELARRARVAPRRRRLRRAPTAACPPAVLRRGCS